MEYCVILVFRDRRTCSFWKSWFFLEKRISLSQDIFFSLVLSDSLVIYTLFVFFYFFSIRYFHKIILNFYVTRVLQVTLFHFSFFSACVCMCLTHSFFILSLFFPLVISLSFFLYFFFTLYVSLFLSSFSHFIFLSLSFISVCLFLFHSTLLLYLFLSLASSPLLSLFRFLALFLSVGMYVCVFKRYLFVIVMQRQLWSLTEYNENMTRI